MGRIAKLVAAGCSAGMLLASCGGAQAESQGWKASSYSHDQTMVVGSGTMVEESRPVAAFDRLEIDGPVDVVIRQGAPSLRIRAEDNIIGLVEAQREGDTLSLATTGGFRTRQGITAYLTVPNLEAVRINASGDVRFEDWNGEAIDLAINGSGDIDLAGDVRDVRALIGGSGSIDLTRVRVARVDADIEGSGTIRTGSPAALDARINGSGLIDAGHVGELSAVLNGSGEIVYASADRIVREVRNGSGRIVRR